MQVVRCENNHYYDKDTYPKKCPLCAEGVEPYVDESLDIGKIYTDTYVGGKKGDKLRKKQAKLIEKENKKILKQSNKRAKKLAKENAKDKKHSKGDVTVEMNAIDSDETVALSEGSEETVALTNSNGEETVMLNQDSDATVILDSQGQ